ncbi:WD40 repeat domain-containing protein [Couchioplanes caeruleus]|uniref:Uncharacterized protein n=2 Tax=Couchioplanes caeruleus TaxID=56438 RepID=A0A1K0GF79_9ACTN|nr:hypothetical protein [Couchioplanes caeruleus]OJF15906.1 hypothetical protein BG844_01320 [Couchioplanes caeruleus subsp. caeruleus]ROP28487.1 WD domain G-beta repeat uncharacterized protein [Couchioplanes caeruleus]
MAGLLGSIALAPVVFTKARHLVNDALGRRDPIALSDGVTLRVLPFMATAYSPDGRTLAVWGDGGIELRDAETGTVRNVLRFAGSSDRRSTVREVDFAPDGSTLAAVLNNEQTIQIWDTKTGTSRTVIKVPVTNLQNLLPLRVSDLVYSPDSRTIAATGDHLQLWDVATGAQRHRIDIAARAAAFAPDGRTIAAAGHRQGGIWNVATGAQIHPLVPAEGWFDWTVRFTPDGRTVITDGNVLRAWDPTTGSLRWSTYGVNPVYAPDGNLLAVTDVDSVWLCDPASGRRLRELPGLTGLLVWGGAYTQVAEVVWAPDSRTLAVRHTGGQKSWNSTPQVWDVETGTALQVLKGHTDDVDDLAYAPDGRTITTVSQDGTTRIWQATP